MLTPTNVTAAQFNTAVKSCSPSHVRMTFAEQEITLTDDDISANGGVIIRDLLNSDTDLTMGKAVMKEVTAYILNTNNVDGLDWEEEFKLETGVEINGSIEWIVQGWFTGVRPEKIYNVDVIQFVAYDRMNQFETIADDWLTNLTYPMTVRQMYDSLCLYCGVANEVGNELTNIMNRSYTAAPILNTGLTCRDILSLIAEACCCYARITNGGKVKLVWFASASYSLTGDDELDINNVDLQSINLMAIDGLNVRQTDDDVGVTISTGSRNTYIIIDNPFLTTADATEEANYIQPIFDRLSGFGGYLPMDVVCIGNPLIETGDIISVAIGNDTFSMPIFSKTEVFNGAFSDEYEATGNMKRKTYSPEVKQKLSQGGRYHILKNNINELYSELYDPTTGDVSILNQTAQALGMSANGIDLTAGKYIRIISGGTFYINATDFTIDSTNKLLKIGNWKFNDDGLVYNYNANSEFRIINVDDVSLFPNMKCGIKTHELNGTYSVSIIAPSVFGDPHEFQFVPYYALNGQSAGISFLPPSNLETDSTLGSDGYEWIKGYIYDLYSYDIYIRSGGTIQFPSNSPGIKYAGSKATSNLIRFINNTADAYGNGIMIGDGGAVIVGAGESAETVRSGASVSGGTEVLYLASDSNIKVLTNVNNGYANRKEFTFGTDGTFVAPGRLYQNGNQMVPLTDTNTWRGYQVKQYQYNYTIPANGGVTITANNFGVSAPSGYVAVALAYYNTSDSNITPYYLDATATGTGTMAALINKANAQISRTMAIKVLYMQTGNP